MSDNGGYTFGKKSSFIGVGTGGGGGGACPPSII